MSVCNQSLTHTHPVDCFTLLNEQFKFLKPETFTFKTLQTLKTGIFTQLETEPSTYSVIASLIYYSHYGGLVVAAASTSILE